jgi:DNA-binding transcriptional LysR family regulator
MPLFDGPISHAVWEEALDKLRHLDRRISLHDLRVVMAVAQAGSMGKAAKQLATSQPAISRSIGTLEQALGVRLFDRSAQGIELTPFGRALVKRGTVVFDELQHGLKDIQFLSNPTVGDLAIGASIAIAEGFVCSVIDRLSRRYPRLTFRVHATDTATAYQALLSRKVDLAIVHAINMPEQNLMSVEELLQDPHVVVAGAHHPIVRRRNVSLAQLVDESWVLPLPDQPYGTVVAEAFRAHGLQVPPFVVGSTLPVRTTLLATGRFLSMVPRVVMQYPPKSRLLRSLPIELPTTTRPLALLTLKNRTLNPLAVLFGDSVREAATRLQKRHR